MLDEYGEIWWSDRRIGDARDMRFVPFSAVGLLSLAVECTPTTPMPKDTLRFPSIQDTNNREGRGPLGGTSRIKTRLSSGSNQCIPSQVHNAFAPSGNPALSGVSVPQGSDLVLVRWKPL